MQSKLRGSKKKKWEKKNEEEREKGREKERKKHLIEIFMWADQSLHTKQQTKKQTSEKQWEREREGETKPMYTRLHEEDFQQKSNELQKKRDKDQKTNDPVPESGRGREEQRKIMQKWKRKRE